MAPRKNYDSSGSENQGEGRSRSNSGSKRMLPEKESEDYKKRRERNNIAVRKSRQLSRMKAKITQEKVSKLREENQKLEQRVQILSKELSVLRDLFLSSAETSAANSVPENTFQGKVGNSFEFDQVFENKAAVQTDHKCSTA